MIDSSSSESESLQPQSDSYIRIYNQENQENHENHDFEGALEKALRMQEEINKFPIKINNKTSAILFIDLSYMIFLNYNALLFYCSQHKNEGEIIDKNFLNTNSDFLPHYSRLFIKKIDVFIKKMKIKGCKIIFGIDCCRDEIWRRENDKEYKSNRDTENVSATQTKQNVELKPKKENNFNPYIFIYTYRNILPLLIKDKNRDCYFLKVQKAEADDMIGLSKIMIRKRFRDIPIYIITNDHDYLQFGGEIGEKTYIYNLMGGIPGKNLKDKSKGFGAKADLLYKILKGDTSDNIKPVFYQPYVKEINEKIKEYNKQLRQEKSEKPARQTIKRMTDKIIIEYIQNETKLFEFLKKNSEFYERYKHNEKLIDIRKNPQEIKDAVMEFYKFD